MKNKILFTIFFLFSIYLNAQINDSLPQVLIVTAHPDDESGFAATVYKITHELHGVVDLAVITNGEAGYKYSLLAEPYYNIKLTDEATGRKYLPTIRKKELMAAGNILGISNYYFFDQQDNHYTLDVDTVLKEVWNVPLVKKRLHDIIENGKYDFIFCLLPTEETHGHHKGATILALQTVSELNSRKPVILGASTSGKNDTTSFLFHGLKNFPLTTITDTSPISSIDRNVSFGFKNQLTYKIIVNWEIAEHKSQGSMQTFMNRGDYENFWYFDMNGNTGRENVKKLFEKLNHSVIK